MTTNNDKNINQFVLQFLDYLLIEKGLSANTISSYKNDLTEFLQFLQKQKISNIDKIDKKVVFFMKVEFLFGDYIFFVPLTFYIYYTQNSQLFQIFI